MIRVTVTVELLQFYMSDILSKCEIKKCFYYNVTAPVTCLSGRCWASRTVDTPLNILAAFSMMEVERLSLMHRRIEK